MRESRFSEEQIIGILQEYAAGGNVSERCRQHGISNATLYKGSSEQRYETHHSISSMVLFCYEICLIAASRLERSFKWQISGG